MSPLSRQSGTLVAAAERAVHARQQRVALAVQRERADAAQRLRVEIGDPDVEVEAVEALLDLPRVERVDRHRHPRVAAEQGRRQQRHAGERRRDRADPKPPGEAAVEGTDLRLEPTDVGEDLPRPLEHALPLGREPVVAVRASHDREPELCLEAPDARGERRLRDVAGARRTTEVLLAGERHEIREMSQIHGLVIDRIYRSVEHPTLTSSASDSNAVSMGRGSTRLTTPLVRDGAELRPATWDEALDRVAEGFGRARAQDTSTSFGIFSCSKASNEMNFLAGKFARQVMGTNNIDSCNRT
jgi:hypothetical protein